MSSPRPELLERVAARGWRVFEGVHDLNLIVERAASRTGGAEDDLLSVVQRQPDGTWSTWSTPCSVDPGLPELRSPSHPRGVARLEVGQYPRSHRPGLHRGRRALVQVGPVSIRRDSDRDDQLDPSSPAESDLFGINIHDDAGLGAAASAGCIVVPRTAIGTLLELVEAQRAAGLGELVTLTVLERS